MTTIIVNEDQIFEVDESSNVRITKNAVFIDTRKVTIGMSTLLEISIEGNLNNLTVDCGNITMSGNVEGDVSVDCGNVTVEGNVQGDVDVDTGNIKIK